jgi:hypothetical protein
MMKNKQRNALLVAAGALGGLLLGQTAPVQAQLGDVLKGGAVLIAVKQLGPQIDRFINTATGNRNHGVREDTKVVPILSIGRGTYAGAVQVTGPTDLVSRVQAVAQLEARTKIGSEVRVRALVPIATQNVRDENSLDRVKGVGVSALVDLRL